MAVQILTQANFNETVQSDKPVIIDFWAPWCAPCRMFAPIFEAAADKHPDILFAKVNTEEEQALASAFGIRSIPTLMVFREQIMLFQQAGALPANGLEQLIGQVRSVDMDEVRRQIEAEKPGQ
ncbi:thioredoxin [Laribacter hongkongensis]|jgi:thioredoxin|uniref:Thioredoxin n=2 Tax=Laribacter hongkongensis TaxID=168471 RepID=C1DCU9_LARHH|nr:thioredoxin [Laribacter hongkongensis]MBP8813483.1 thioredoxin [Laribacter sp.]ACO73584.1 thioredoxin [Laribacter hongkongensis HLHK9]ASJ23413.1 thiol reductase thioredoxin [Laribacter hongkongensis]MBE5528195.1 thioredoxin [Laribacter hongkongensis]MBP9527920.1 thioredoxin [Laribacter sp.]